MAETSAEALMGLVEVVSNDDTREEVLQLREEYARLMQQNDRELEHLSSQYYAQAEAAKQALEAQSARVVSCDQCGKAISRRLQCSKCKAATYCCKEHQVAAWPTHKAFCKSLVAARAAGATVSHSQPPPPPPLEHKPTVHNDAECLSSQSPQATASQASAAPEDGTQEDNGRREASEVEQHLRGAQFKAMEADPELHPQESHPKVAAGVFERNTDNRMRMLRLWTKLQGSHAVVSCHGRTKVSGIFECTDAEQEVLLMSQLETPLGTYARSLVRGSDVIAVDFN